MITKCPGCKKVFDVDPSWESQEVTCDSCNKDFLVKKYIECPTHPTTNSKTADEAVLNSVSPIMRFWIRLCAVGMLLTTIVIFGASVYRILSSRYEGGDIKKLTILVLISFLTLMAANMMSDSAKTKAKITYNMFHKIVALLFSILVLVNIVFLAYTIRVGWLCGALVNAYTCFIAWKLYKKRAVAQAENPKLNKHFATTQPPNSNITKKNKKMNTKHKLVGILFFIVLAVLAFSFSFYSNYKYTTENYFKIGKNCYATKYYKIAAMWYRKAAKRGNVDAQFALGSCYLFGNGVAEDYKKAVKWYRKAAEQGYALAQYRLGVCYYYGRDGVAKDYKEAVKWWRKAAEQGCRPAIRIFKRLGPGF